jgi:hypothetical protein
MPPVRNDMGHGFSFGIFAEYQSSINFINDKDLYGQ